MKTRSLTAKSISSPKYQYVFGGVVDGHSAYLPGDRYKTLDSGFSYDRSTAEALADEARKGLNLGSGLNALTPKSNISLEDYKLAVNAIHQDSEKPYGRKLAQNLIDQVEASLDPNTLRQWRVAAGADIPPAPEPASLGQAPDLHSGGQLVNASS